jgi:uncharacterized membrane protein
MKEQKQEEGMSIFNLVLWLIGSFYLGWMLRQTLINIFKIDIDYDIYEKNFTWIQFFTYLPFGAIAVKATKAKFGKYITALLTIFSLHLINVSADIASQLDDPWSYVKENKEEVWEYFADQVIWLLPLLVGFAVILLIQLVAPKISELEFVKKAIAWMKNFWTDKLTRLFASSKEAVKNGVENLKKKQSELKEKKTKEVEEKKKVEKKKEEKVIKNKDEKKKEEKKKDKKKSSSKKKRK